MSVDYPTLRRNLVALQESMRHVGAEVCSDDGMIRATVNGRGELVALDLDPRIFRVHHSRLLAEQIAETVRQAAALVNDRLSALADELVFHRPSWVESRHVGRQ